MVAACFVHGVGNLCWEGQNKQTATSEQQMSSDSLVLIVRKNNYEKNSLSVFVAKVWRVAGQFEFVEKGSN